MNRPNPARLFRRMTGTMAAVLAMTMNAGRELKEFAQGHRRGRHKPRPYQMPAGTKLSRRVKRRGTFLPELLTVLVVDSHITKRKADRDRVKLYRKCQVCEGPTRNRRLSVCFQCSGASPSVHADPRMMDGDHVRSLRGGASRD